MQLRLTQVIPQTNDISTFVFTPAEPIDWKAGQSIKLEVQGIYGPLEHRFTISAAPHERNIAITTRSSDSAYKKRLFAMQPGDLVRAFAIEGAVIWQDTPCPKIWVAAGIGITPFYAMVKDRSHKSLPISATLFYSSRAEFLFKEELDAIATEHPELKIIYLDNRATVDQILAEPDAKRRLIFISGPSAMVDELSSDLVNKGIARFNLMQDWFTGRLSADG